MLRDRLKATADTLYEIDGQPMRQEDAIDAGKLYCEQFAMCTNMATTALAHPILGLVPACERCAAKMAALA